MKAILIDKDESGKHKEVKIDTEFMFDNQYNTIPTGYNADTATNGKGEKSGKRIFDGEILQIIDDVRPNLWVGGGIQGTREQVQKAIDAQRAKINQCTSPCGKKDCFWWQLDRIETISDTKTTDSDGVEVRTTKEKRHYHCGYTAQKKDGQKPYGEKCVNDIDTEPKPFPYAKCFFSKYPNGLQATAATSKNFAKWLLANADRLKLVKQYGTWGDTGKRFGSYFFEIRETLYGAWANFEMSNCRNRNRFMYDFATDKFVVWDSHSPKATKYLYENWSDKNVIKGFDKFIKWFNPIVAEFKASQGGAAV